jgi:ribonuclease D
LLNGRELIVHGGDYDLRLLYRTYRFVPQSVFDTMLGARLLGHTEFGLIHLVNKLLGVPLEKGPQKADWARRPLTGRMEQYARNDTRFLKPLADLLRAELERKGRLEWHGEMCARLIEDCARSTPPDLDQVWRLKGADRLNRRGLAVLRELWRWRNQEALAANKPPYFVLSHEAVVKLAETVATGHDLESLLPPRLNLHRRSRLLEAVQKALALSPEKWPHPIRPSGKRPTLEENARFDQLRQKRDQAAAGLGIDPTLIASRATLFALARNWEQSQRELMAWQRALLSSDKQTDNLNVR